MKRIIRDALKKFGIQIKRFPDIDDRRKMQLISELDIEIVLDVGANVGQYGSNLREIGYTKEIVSFEPLKSAFQTLQNASKNDNSWSVNNYALGDEDGIKSINVSGNSASSSILEMLPSHLESAPESLVVATEEIEVKRLDAIFDSICEDKKRIMLKIDTQGFEKKVLDGAAKILDKVYLIQLEMSIVPLYDSETLLTPMIEHLDELGFQLVSLENGFSDKKTGQLLQVDGVFANKRLLSNSKL